MARARNIKPGFFKNDRLAECQPLARILFSGLWCEADREGRLEDRPKRLKAEYLAYDNCDVDELLTELEQRGFIIRYVIDGAPYIAIPAFKKHQNPHVREPASSIPAPDMHSACTGIDPVQAQCSHSSGPADSPSLIPDSPIQKKPLAQPAERRVENPTVEFDRFWAAYPRHAGKRAAMKAFAKLKPDGELLGRMLAAVKRQQQTDQWQRDGGQYIPHAATWLNGRRWEDEVPMDLGDSGDSRAENSDLLRRAI
ncbi:hypothetical protein [Dyella acidiphila]|uniref:Helix-turn-helix domain-containing protein n=1 Tax=Dyella acidiphila TaxID=2775866 RepID=A0ABR9G6G6_9GAMM|nr:hypothetical protein [Dyella acidiphila]MBE1159633.1 hypothetical protein [Dyella acidiphila]